MPPQIYIDQQKKLKFISLFSGIGGFDLGLERAGMECIAQVEIDPFCNKVLNKHWPNVQKFGDIKNFGKHSIKEETVDLICAGVPCQPASIAGKRRGTKDDRWLWGETYRIIREVKPEWVLLENVKGLISLESGLVFENLLLELESYGYKTETFIIPACAVNAPHRRDRVWIIANSERIGRKRWDSNEGKTSGTDEERTATQFKRSSEAFIDNPRRFRQEKPEVETSKGLQGNEQPGTFTEGRGTSRPTSECTWNENWIEVAIKFCGIFNGLSDWIHRNGGLIKYVKIINTIAEQDLPYLWKGFQSNEMEWDIGGFKKIPFKENVFTVLWQFFSQSYRQNNLSFESKEVQEAYLRNVWFSEKIGCTPQRWEYQEQYAKEYSNSLSCMSHEITLATKEISNRYGKNRINRLKSLGNAVVPQIVEILGRIISICHQ